MACAISNRLLQTLLLALYGIGVIMVAFYQQQLKQHARQIIRPYRPFSGIASKNQNQFQSLEIGKMPFTRQGLHDIYIFSVTLGNSSSVSAWDIVMISLWIHKNFSLDESKFQCCLYYKDETIVKSAVKHISVIGAAKDFLRLPGVFMACRNLLHSSNQIPSRVAITPLGTPCFEGSSNSYVPAVPIYKLPDNTIGLCAKLAYGSLNAEALIEWFEMQKFLGVNKVLTYMDSTLNSNATRVLKYYEHSGILQALKFDLPMKDKIRRYVGKKGNQAFSDESVVIFDCLMRLGGHHYILLLDFDEYLTPLSLNVSLIDLAKQLFKSKSQASEFRFKTAVYATAWGKVNPSGEFMTTQYLNRTEPFWDRPKYLFMPNRTELGGLRAHWAKPKQPFKRAPCSSQHAVVRHYRSCRNDWYTGGAGGPVCGGNVSNRITDYFMEELMTIIRTNVIKTRKLLLDQ